MLTFVGVYEDKQVAAAIRRELLRDGQVFYVHNRVESIEKAAARLRQLVPEARIATAHGQMNEETLRSGLAAFHLYETYGMPLDFMVDAARDGGIHRHPPASS